VKLEHQIEQTHKEKHELELNLEQRRLKYAMIIRNIQDTQQEIQPTQPVELEDEEMEN
jgi:hypothetical protein